MNFFFSKFWNWIEIFVWNFEIWSIYFCNLNWINWFEILIRFQFVEFNFGHFVWSNQWLFEFCGLISCIVCVITTGKKGKKKERKQRNYRRNRLIACFGIFSSIKRLPAIGCSVAGRWAFGAGSLVSGDRWTRRKIGKKNCVVKQKVQNEDRRRC